VEKRSTAKTPQPTKRQCHYFLALWQDCVAEYGVSAGQPLDFAQRDFRRYALAAPKKI